MDKKWVGRVLAKKIYQNSWIVRTKSPFNSGKYPNINFHKSGCLMIFPNTPMHLAYKLDLECEFYYRLQDQLSQAAVELSQAAVNPFTCLYNIQSTGLSHDHHVIFWPYKIQFKGEFGTRVVTHRLELIVCASFSGHLKIQCFCLVSGTLSSKTSYRNTHASVPVKIKLCIPYPNSFIV